LFCCKQGALNNEKANTAPENSLQTWRHLTPGNCNGCQLFMELEVIIQSMKLENKAAQRKSQTRKYLTSVTVQENKSVMLSH
jgi:phosphoribosylformylglycinamidine synthase